MYLVCATVNSLRVSFSRVNMDYVLQSAEGNIAGTVSMGYDIKANTAS